MVDKLSSLNPLGFRVDGRTQDIYKLINLDINQMFEDQVASNM